jgi:hypothetical protein
VRRDLEEVLRRVMVVGIKVVDHPVEVKSGRCLLGVGHPAQLLSPPSGTGFAKVIERIRRSWCRRPCYLSRYGYGRDAASAAPPGRRV